MGSRGTMVVEEEGDVFLFREKDPAGGAKAGDPKATGVSVTTAGGGKPAMEASSTWAVGGGPAVVKTGSPSGWGTVSRGYREEMEHFAYCIRMWDQGGSKNDRPNVRWIVHNGLPTSIEAYYQEIGRAAHDGQHGHCMLVLTEFDVRDNNSPSDFAKRDRAVADCGRAYLDIMLSYKQTKYVMAWGLVDRYSWLQDRWPRDDGLPKRPNPYDNDYRSKLLREALADAFRKAPART